MSSILSALSAIKGLWDILKALLNMWRQFQADQLKREEEKRKRELEKALEDAAKAKTPEEKKNAARRIADNSF